MNKKKYVVSFPRLGNYVYPIYNMLERLVDPNTTEIMMPEAMTKRTIDLGSNSSPDFVCVPFKYNMGNFIESLEKGANFLIQAGGGCRYGYYAEVQEQILKDMGYEFTYISLLEAKGIDPLKIYKNFRLLNTNLSFTKFANEFLLAIKAIEVLDDFETYMRKNYILEQHKGEFDRLHKEFIDKISNLYSMVDLFRVRALYFKKLKNIKLKDLEKDTLKVGIVGELYTSMEPFSSFFIEKELAKMNVKVRRYTTVTYLLFKKGKSIKKHIKYANKYIEYALGADGTESIAHTLELINDGYDGIIHIKPFGCTPEVNAMPILQKISSEKDIPIMYLTFDSQTSETGVQTRLEAFYDMLKMKKENELALDKVKESDNKDKENIKKELELEKHKYEFQN